MLLFDSHLDLGLNAVDWNRDLRMDVHDIRVQEAVCGMTDAGRQTGTVSLPELRKAEIGICVATVLGRIEQATNHSFGYSTPHACYAIAQAHLAYYKAMERDNLMRMIRTKSELAAHVAQYQASPARTPLGYILSMECGDAILDPENIHDWHAQGLRAIGITHYGTNRYGGGTRSEVGLTVEALPLLKNIEKLGIALDLTHLSDRSFNQVRDCFGGRVLASHQNARKFCDWQRQFNDEQIRFVLERDGVIGIAFDAIMLQPGWVRSVTKPIVTMERAADNIDHICQLAGNAKHVGIGSDLDGGFGFEQTPADLNTIADLQKITGILERRGYRPPDIAGIFHGNWLRFFGEVLPTE
jgi:membrane dipeptidase